ncbi:MAG: hypothetical protein ACTSVY_10110 [Candidatus Helarchaeota archaeon]
MTNTLEKCIKFEETIKKFEFPLTGSQKSEFQEWKKLSSQVIKEHEKNLEKFQEYLEKVPPLLDKAFSILNSCQEN